MFQGLRARLLLSYLAVMAAILSVFGTGVYIFFSRNLSKQLDKKLVTLAQSGTIYFTSIKEGGEQYLNQRQEVPWRDIFNRDQQSLEWFDEQGNLIARKGKIRLNEPPKTGTIFLPRESNATKIRTHTTAIRLRKSIESGPSTLIGYVRASQSLEEIEEARNQLLLVLIIGGLLTLILIGLGGLWLSQKAIEPIEASFQKLKQFTADASHELRSPLTAIKASVDVMRNHPERIHPKDGKKLAAISGATLQMSHTLEDLLFLARNDANTSVIGTDRQFEQISLTKILQNCFVLLEPLANEKKITFKSELEPEIDVLGDRAQLSRLFSNLLENALQYTPEAGMVSLQLSKQNRLAIVKIQDTGIGIPPEQIERVFDRFWRANKARSRREGGTGLGLAIAKTITQRHGGKITVESEVDVGSCFQVRLPILIASQLKKTATLRQQQEY